jgi:hypothetical protein
MNADKRGLKMLGLSALIRVNLRPDAIFSQLLTLAAPSRTNRSRDRKGAVMRHLPPACNALAAQHRGAREESLAAGPIVRIIVHEFEVAFP